MTISHFLKLTLIFLVTFNISDQLFSQEIPIHSPKIGLALSGGGALGLAHIGVLKVLEKEGVKIDYIAGTSMGSIVGGLYAVGYSADEIEKIVLNQNWSILLSDFIPRNNIPVEEKDEYSRYILKFPFRSGKISLPKGLISGHNVKVLLTNLTIPFHSQKDFSKLPIPFLSIATDIETGEEVILDKGFLPEVMRASMSIPSIFTPIKINNRLLVDGGVVRNLPALKVKAMGAEIVIGVDVGKPLATQDELTSLTEIMSQTVTIYGAKTNQEELSYCNIVIQPDLANFNPTDFEKVKELIKKGEQAAEAMFCELAPAMANQIKTGVSHRMPSIKTPDFFNIIDIKINGSKQLSNTFIKGMLQIKPPKKVTIQNLKNAINRLYGTQFFEQVNYQILPSPHAYQLIIHTIERAGHHLNFGLSYDSDAKSAILFNSTLRNLFHYGSRLFVDFILGENPVIAADLYFPSSIPGYNYSMSVIYNKFDFYQFHNGNKVGLFDFHTTKLRFSPYYNFFNVVSTGLGIENEYASVHTEFSMDWSGINNLDYLNYYAFINVDTMNRTLYPTSGLQICGEVKYITMGLFLREDKNYEPIIRSNLNLHFVTPLFSRLALRFDEYIGSCSKEMPPGIYNFHVGGAYSNDKMLIPFIGFNQLEAEGPNTWVSHMAIQYNPWNNIYIVARGNIGKVERHYQDLFNMQNLMWGYGMTLGILTPILPIELSFGISDKQEIGHLKIGYRF